MRGQTIVLSVTLVIVNRQICKISHIANGLSVLSVCVCVCVCVCLSVEIVRIGHILAKITNVKK